MPPTLRAQLERGEAEARGRFPSLLAVVRHYDDWFKLGLSAGEQRDLVEYLKGR